MRSPLLLLAIAGHAAAQNFPQAFPNLCGTYGDMNNCTQYAAQSTQETIEMTGITSGTYTMQQKLYNSSDCQTPTLTQTVYAQGIWQDLGPLDTTATVRWFLPEECLTHLIAIFSPFVQFGRRPVRLFQPLSVPSSPLPHPAVCARIGPHSCCLFLPDTTLLGWMMLHFVQFAAHSFPVLLAVSSEATTRGCPGASNHAWPCRPHPIPIMCTFASLLVRAHSAVASPLPPSTSMTRPMSGSFSSTWSNG